ncbi:MAG: HAD family phosphatase [Solobacterium sp.]|nr:HAD family phosphatase [Solobacterium sp.]
MKYEAVIFDFDGVIVDSEVIFTAALKQFFETLGFEADQPLLNQFTGIPVNATIRKIQHLVPDRYSEEELQNGLANMYRTCIANHYAKPMPGVQEFFDLLKEKGIRTALGTSRGKENVLSYIRDVGLEMPFDVVVTHEDVTKGKPDPETFLKAAEKLAVEKDRILIIEDSENGIRAGRAAGIFTVGFKGSSVVQNTAEADKEVSSYEELKNWLQL